MIRIGKLPDPLGLFGLDIPPLAVELIVEGPAGHDHGLQLLAMLVHDVLFVGEHQSCLILLKKEVWESTLGQLLML